MIEIPRILQNCERIGVITIAEYLVWLSFMVSELVCEENCRLSAVQSAIVVSILVVAISVTILMLIGIALRRQQFLWPYLSLMPILVVSCMIWKPVYMVTTIKGNWWMILLVYCHLVPPIMVSFASQELSMEEQMETLKRTIVEVEEVIDVKPIYIPLKVQESRERAGFIEMCLRSFFEKT